VYNCEYGKCDFVRSDNCYCDEKYSRPSEKMAYVEEADAMMMRTERYRAAAALCPTCKIKETCPYGGTDVIVCRHYEKVP
jgi:hypothetical protein